MSDADDLARGRLLRRREALALIGAGALATRASARAAALACVARPEQAEGPFFVDERLTRPDIRSDPATGHVSPGAPLELTLALATPASGTCKALQGAVVEVWQCDAAGRYSDVRDYGGSTAGQRFLRGNQTSDADGLVRFVTIVPGWYEGRAVHIHFAVDAVDRSRRARRFTSQLYFDDAFLDRIHAQAPYAARGPRRLRNDGDFLYRAGGSRLVLDVREGGERLAARFDVGLTV
jgi:protocatechuate 3,4-dioxygenase beta subunit